jgi:hypothetical protein
MIGLATVFGSLAYSGYLVWKSMRKSSTTTTATPAAGTPAAGTTAAPAATAPVVTPPTKKSRIWVWAVLITILSIAIGIVIAYQNGVGPLLGSSIGVTTPAASPTPAATAPKAAVNKGKGTIIPVPGKVPGDNAWKHAYIFQLKSGYFKFRWDVEGPMGWEIRDEETKKVYTDLEVKDPKKEVPITQNGWIRIRAKGSTPLQVTAYTYW